MTKCELSPIDAYSEITFGYDCKASKCAKIAISLNMCQNDTSECDKESENYNKDLSLALEKIGIRVK